MSGGVLTILITVCCVPKNELLLAIGPLWTVPANAMFYVGTLGKKLPTKLQQLTITSADKKCGLFNDKYNAITYQNIQHVQPIHTSKQ